MPLYDFRCGACDAVREEFRPYDRRDGFARCQCGGTMARVWLPARVQSDIEPYQSMVTGEMITSRSQHRDHLKRHHVVEFGNDTPNVRRGGPTIPRDSIRRELRNVAERMKAEGTWRER